MSEVGLHAPVGDPPELGEVAERPRKPNLLGRFKYRVIPRAMLL